MIYFFSPSIHDIIYFVSCQVIVKNPGDLMCDCYGSHVLRSLLSLFKGVPLDSSEFNRRKSSSALAERLNFKAFRADTDISPPVQGFPGLLDFLVSGMSKCIQNNIKTMQVDQYSSLVLQASSNILSYYFFLLLGVAFLFECQLRTDKLFITKYIKIKLI